MATCEHRRSSPVGGICDACARLLEEALENARAREAEQRERFEAASKLTRKLGVLPTAQRIKAELEAARQAQNREVLPMYESRYREPADRGRFWYTHDIVGRIGQPTNSDDEDWTPPLDEHQGQANELTSRAPKDIEYAIRTETGMRGLHWGRPHGGRYTSIFHGFVSQPTFEYDDFTYKRRLDPELDVEYRPYHDLSREDFQKVQASRANEDVFRHAYPMRRLGRTLSADPMWLAMEYGLDPLQFLIEDDPRELTCVEDGHIDMPDRWSVYYKD